MFIGAPMPTPAPAQVSSRPYDPLPRGEYAFEVVSTEERTSKSSGLPMVALRLLVRGSAGQCRTVFDYLPSSEKARWKTESLAAAVGLLELYESGAMGTGDLEGATGCLFLDMRDATDQYPADNVVKRYLVPEGKGRRRPPSPSPSTWARSARSSSPAGRASRPTSTTTDRASGPAGCPGRASARTKEATTRYGRTRLARPGSRRAPPQRARRRASAPRENGPHPEAELRARAPQPAVGPERA